MDVRRALTWRPRAAGTRDTCMYPDHTISTARVIRSHSQLKWMMEERDGSRPRIYADLAFTQHALRALKHGGMSSRRQQWSQFAGCKTRLEKAQFQLIKPNSECRSWAAVVTPSGRSWKNYYINNLLISYCVLISFDINIIIIIIIAVIFLYNIKYKWLYINIIISFCLSCLHLY